MPKYAKAFERDPVSCNKSRIAGSRSHSLIGRPLGSPRFTFKMSTHLNSSDSSKSHLLSASSYSASTTSPSLSHRKLCQSQSCSVTNRAVIGNGSTSPAVTRSRAQELDQLLLRLEQGSLLVRFYSKGKPERRTFALKANCGQLLCMKPSAGIESYVNLFEVREVRTGRCSKVFEKWAEDARKYDNGQCFVVLYGPAFRLKSLSCVGKCRYFFKIGIACNYQRIICFYSIDEALSVKECEQWVRGIKHLASTAHGQTYHATLTGWLRREFNLMCNDRPT